jgi:CO/xanthine dehydrogenase Mo-binding subunit
MSATEAAYIGQSVPRPQVRRLVEGQAQYIDDILLPRMVHVAFLRSPYAHARINGIDTERAKEMPGVVRVVTGRDFTDVKTFAGVLAHFQGMKSAQQPCLAIDRVCWCGEPVAAIVAETRHQAEDALDAIEIDYDELPVVVDIETALDPSTPVIHPDIGAGQGRSRDRTDLSFPTAYRRLSRGTLGHRRLAFIRAPDDSLYLSSGAEHGAGLLCGSAGSSGECGSGHLQGRWRFLRDKDPCLWR